MHTHVHVPWPKVLKGAQRRCVLGQVATTLAVHMRPLLVDVIEPDATVISLARRYFGFDPPAWRYSPAASPASSTLASRPASPASSPGSPASASTAASAASAAASAASAAWHNGTLLQTSAGSARLSRVRLIETDALSWLRGAPPGQG